MIIDFSKTLTPEEEAFVIEQYHKIIGTRYRPEHPQDLREYEHKIGMTQIIQKHLDLSRNSGGKQGKYWMSLSPRWDVMDSKHRKDTEYRILYWVNYGDDETYGWFTVEQIKQWLETPDLKLYKLGGRRERISK